MPVKQYLLIILRTFFVLFSLIFLYDAFYKWDGYSFYIRFSDFLPDLSLAFFLWTLEGIVLAFAFWFAAYLLFKVLSSFIRAVCFEHIITWYVIAAFMFVVKEVLDISLGGLSGLIGVNRFVVLIVFGIVVTGIVLFGRKLVEKYTGKVLLKINDFITPLVLVFAFLFILSVPLSFPAFKREYAGADHIPNAGQVDVSKNRPNILFLSMDALGARDMDTYGYHRPTTPFITEWSRDAVLFKRAYASSNWTPPTTMTMMTGQRPWTHRNWHLTFNWPYKRYEQSLPKLLQERGYATYAFVQNYNAHPNSHGISGAFLVKDPYYTFRDRPSGFEGRLYDFINYFEEITMSRIAIDWAIKHPLFRPVWVVYPSDRKTPSSPPEMVYERFLDQIVNSPQRPYFAWVHLEVPHYPFLPPEQYMGKFGDGDKFDTEFKQMQANLLEKEYELDRQNEVDILKKRQDEFILYADHTFKVFLSNLSEATDVSNTVIIVSADHGTSMSRGYAGHGNERLYENVTHIPLIIKMPDSKGEKGKINGRTIDFPVEQVDIAPTILDLAGLPIPEWMEGRSFVPLLEGKYLEPLPVFSMELGLNNAMSEDPLTKYSIAVWEGDYKLIYYENRKEKETELFDLNSDPDELHNLFNSKPEVAQRLLDLIRKNLKIAMKGL